MAHTPEELVEELNAAAEYARCPVEFGWKPSGNPGCCLVTWGAVGVPHDRHENETEVHIVLAYGHTKNIPDRAFIGDFLCALANATPEDAKAAGFLC